MTDSPENRPFVALLCAVNVGGTGKLPMSDLRAMCERIGFDDVRTYIASGNVLFSTGLDADAARDALEAALDEYAGRPVGVVLRTPAEVARVRDANPFPSAVPSRVGVVFLDAPPDADTAGRARGVSDEEIALGDQEIYVHYPQGMGRSRLHLPGATGRATTRNMNTVTKLAALAAERP
ncbi:DUF1697 domain-containing protein [Isoptericola sp. S6320L]|uniref:DUF1697 domain-containing protein n=1 Tax=Isoptericola sp. S6320L TaxID=2926411 RepID=UPI001FF3CE21|nr:DUF1697 domain-containing protein [Isoptericola sp. S6320L]MCK0115915.1 DUF1697 domain-containing protein [Isoptericola sp. S6320L]